MLFEPANRYCLFSCHDHKQAKYLTAAKHSVLQKLGVRSNSVMCYVTQRTAETLTQQQTAMSACIRPSCKTDNPKQRQAFRESHSGLHQSKQGQLRRFSLEDKVRSTKEKPANEVTHNQVQTSMEWGKDRELRG